MSHPKSSHPPTDHPDDGHPEPVETEEERADRERAARVEEAWARALKLPGTAVALVFAGLSLAWLASLASGAPAMTWAWLPVFVLLFAWGVALARDAGAPEPEAPPSGGPPAH